tara:strand:- start:1205 stop:2137 length:933 start_codon:yes stop_codon:yes gene_type:complete
MNLYIATPRGFCAGVVRAIDIVEMSLKKWGPPIYVRHEIVHNKYVVSKLKEKGVIFVKELEECPVDKPVIFSAHGVAKTVVSEAKRRNMIFVDATCPLVSKVHIEAERHNKNGLQIIMIGHKGHPETIGTMGQLKKNEVLLVENVHDVFAIEPRDDNKLAYITQTTLSVDDTKDVVEALKKRFPNIVGPHKEDICYATTNRQEAVKKISSKIEALLVVGSSNSSNSKRLVEVGQKAGCKYSQLIENEDFIDWDALRGMKSIGLTAGASAPDTLIQGVINALSNKFNISIKSVDNISENVTFKVPKILREL